MRKTYVDTDHRDQSAQIAYLEDRIAALQRAMKEKAATDKQLVSDTLEELQKIELQFGMLERLVQLDHVSDVRTHLRIVIRNFRILHGLNTQEDIRTAVAKANCHTGQVTAKGAE